jgi:hypothetical protein
MDGNARRFESFAEFYPHYLAAHSTRANRRLHFLGTTLAVLLAIAFAASGDWRLLAAVPLAGYGFSWAGHVLFEKNRPAAFRHPIYSLLGDLLMAWQMFTGRVKL